jgi:WD40 repeat protein/DNA-binding SARP family transcriptional activator
VPLGAGDFYTDAVRYAILGPLEVSNGDRIVTVGGLKERVLLAVLLACRGSVVQAGDLVDALWGAAAPRSAGRTLAAHVTRLRAVLEPDHGTGERPGVIRTAGAGWRLDVGPAAVDSGRFEQRSRLASAALREGRFVEAAGLAAAALAEWRGAAYDGFCSVDLCAREAARLDALRAAALEDAAESGLALGRARELISELELAVGEEPLRERRWALLMLALYRAGRQADALGAYRRARAALRDQVSVDPGAELQRLHLDMLRQAPSLLAPMAQPKTAMAGPGCPFKGLAAYTEADAALLLGRERLVARLVARLAEAAAVCLVGASGSGKSSLLQAGLLPAVRAGALEGSEHWRVAVLTPGERPEERLAAAGAAGLVVVDQLEELFAICGDAEERQRFAVRLVKLASGGARLALAVRSDYWADAAGHPELAELITTSSVAVGPLTDDELRRVVAEGARRAGLAADDDLVETLVAGTAGQQGVLPLVSTALARTWDRRDGIRLTLGGYRAAGGVDGAVAGLAEDTYAGLSADEQRAARAILTRLAAEGSGGRLVRRRAPVAELAPPQSKAAQAALWRMVAARLVVAGDEGAEVAHEALFARWPRLARWLEDDAAGRRLRQRLTPAAADWDAHARPDADLYRGPRLVEALDWQAQHPDELIPAEQEFLDASARAAERERLDALAQAEREARASRRLRGLLAATAALLAAALVAGLLAVGAEQRASDARDAAFADQLGAQALLAPRQDLVLLLAAQAARLRPGPDTESDLLAAVLRAPRALRVSYLGHRLTGVAVSPDGRVLAVSDNEGEIRLLDPRTLTVTRVLRPPTGWPAGGLAFTADGRLLLSGDQIPALELGARVRLRDVGTGRVVLSLPALDAYDVAITPDGSRIATGANGGSYFWRRGRAGWRRTAYGPNHDVTNFSRDGRLFAVLSSSGGAVLRSARTGAVLRRLPAASTNPGAAALSPSGRVLATSDPAGVVRLWDTATGRQLSELAGLPAAATSLAFSPSGRLLLAGGGDGTAIAWDVATGRVIANVTASQGLLWHAVFAPDERTVYTIAQDGTVASWDLTGRRGFGTWAPVPAGAQAAAMSPGGSRLLLGTATGQVTVLGPALSTQRRIAVTGSVTALAVSPDGQLAAAGTQQGTVSIVALSTGAVIARIGGLHAVGGLAWSPDGRLLAATDQQEHRVRVVTAATWRTATAFGVPAPPAFGVPSQLGQVAWSPDGRLLAIGVTGSSVAIADPRTGRLLRRLWVSRDPVAPSVAFTRGSVLAVGARDGTVRFWDAATGKPVSAPLPGTTGFAQQLSASRDGGLVAASGDDGSLVLLDAAHFRRLGAALPPPAGLSGSPVLAVVDSRRARLVSIYSNGKASVWPLAPARWLARACAVPGRHLTPAEWRLYLGARPYEPAC